MRLVIFGVVVVVVAALTAGAPLAESAFPGKGGKIAFHSDRDGNLEVYAMGRDGGKSMPSSAEPLRVDAAVTRIRIPPGTETVTAPFCPASTRRIHSPSVAATRSSVSITLIGAGSPLGVDGSTRYPSPTIPSNAASYARAPGAFATPGTRVSRSGEPYLSSTLRSSGIGGIPYGT